MIVVELESLNKYKKTKELKRRVNLITEKSTDQRRNKNHRRKYQKTPNGDQTGGEQELANKEERNYKLKKIFFFNFIMVFIFV